MAETPRNADNSRATVLTPDVIRQALERLAAILDENGIAANITVYGGASLALGIFANDRTATADVDGAYSPVAPIEDAATQVADELQLAPGWLNNRMQGFLPPDGIDDSREFIERGGVTITLGSARTLLALKLRASRPNRDFEDIAVLIRACNITTVTECEALVEEFFLGEEEIPPRGYKLLELAFDEVTVRNANPPYMLAAVPRPRG